MNAPASAKLYSPEILGLATRLAAYPFDQSLPFKSEARSRTCGSAIVLGMAVDGEGCVTRIGMRVSACALGQASAALLAEGADSADAASIIQTTAGIESWLAGQGELPQWPGLDALIPALGHSGRHGALLLPWKAACMALSSGTAGG